ncbi:MAG: winged helix-turn-helix transcriptional regulator, partial [Clostridia bacterium]|nr:winged helix-turn-helix transcriptional regulator [Clostridia bacterium]
MKYFIDQTKKETAYLQLYKQVKDDIINGVYGYGSKLPSKRLTASETGVSTVTVEHAYVLLCDEGYIESRERSGYIVIFRQEDGFMSSSEVVDTD